MNEYIGELVEENGIFRIYISFSGQINYLFQQQLKAAEDINACFQDNLIEVEKNFLGTIKTIFPVIDTEFFANQLILDGELKLPQKPNSNPFKYVSANISLNIPDDFNYVIILMNYLPYLMKGIELSIGDCLKSYFYRIPNHEKSHYYDIKSFGIGLRILLLETFTKKQTLPNYANVYHNFSKYENQLTQNIMARKTEIEPLVDKILERYQFNLTMWQNLQLTEKIKALRELARNIRRESNPDDIDFIINYINFETKRRLVQTQNEMFIQKVNGKEAPYFKTPISFELALRNADMTLGTDGRLSLSLSDKLRTGIMSSYSRPFAKKPDFELGFRNALQNLSSSLGEIHIEEDSDCENKIIFTRESTQKLLHIGFHLNAEYMRGYELALKELRNNTQRVGITKICTEKRHFKMPPRDIIKRINLFANAEQLPHLTSEDLKKCFGEEIGNAHKNFKL